MAYNSVLSINRSNSQQKMVLKRPPSSRLEFTTLIVAYELWAESNVQLQKFTLRKLESTHLNSLARNRPNETKIAHDVSCHHV